MITAAAIGLLTKRVWYRVLGSRSANYSDDIPPPLEDSSYRVDL